MNTDRAKALLTSVLLMASATARSDDSLQALLTRTLEDARAKHEVPAIAAMVQIDGRLEASGVVGVRATGHPERATIDDLWQIGSDTKAFTATLVMRLASKGVLSLDDTLAQTLPSLAARMDPAYRDVTVAELLSHTAGLPALTDPRELPAFRAVIAAERDVRAQRQALAGHYLSSPPPSKRGSFNYSNLGYIIAGAIVETRTGRSWEEAMRAEVFAPLEIAHAGFGPPGTSRAIDQPRGHRQSWWRLVPLDPADPRADNPPALGPAGTIHMSLAEWMRFAQDQLDGERGRGKLFDDTGYRRMHAPRSEKYALGWGVALDQDGAPRLLAHTGSNGYWLADVAIIPERQAIVLVTMNAGNGAAMKALQDIRKPLLDALR